MNGRERPTARQRDGFDLSPDLDRASAAPADRSEECICGGLIAVLEGEDIGKVVEMHNRSALHTFWRWRTGRLELQHWLG